MAKCFARYTLALLLVLSLFSASEAEQPKPIAGAFNLSEKRALLGGPIGVLLTIRNESSTDYCELDMDRLRPLCSLRAQMGKLVVTPVKAPDKEHSRYTPVCLAPKNTFVMTVWASEFLRFERPGLYRLECKMSIPTSMGSKVPVIGPRNTYVLDIKSSLSLRLLPPDEKEIRKQLSELRSQTSKGEVSKALDAVRGIASVKGAAASDLLEEIVGQGRIEVVGLAAWLLAKRSDDGARRLAGLAPATRGYVRVVAIRALGVSDAPSSEGLLAPMLGDADPRTRLAAFEALVGRMQLMDSTKEKMSRLRGDPDPKVRQRVMVHDKGYEHMAASLRKALAESTDKVRRRSFHHALEKIEGLGARKKVQEIGARPSRDTDMRQPASERAPEPLPAATSSDTESATKQDPGGPHVDEETGDTTSPYLYLVVAGGLGGTALGAWLLFRRRRT